MFSKILKSARSLLVDPAEAENPRPRTRSATAPQVDDEELEEELDNSDVASTDLSAENTQGSASKREGRSKMGAGDGRITRSAAKKKLPVRAKEAEAPETPTTKATKIPTPRSYPVVEIAAKRISIEPEIPSNPPKPLVEDAEDEEEEILQKSIGSKEVIDDSEDENLSPQKFFTPMTKPFTPKSVLSRIKHQNGIEETEEPPFSTAPEAVEISSEEEDENKEKEEEEQEQIEEAIEEDHDEANEENTEEIMEEVEEEGSDEESEDSDDEAPEAIGKEEAVKNIKSRQQEAARAVKEQEEATRKKRKHRDEILKQQSMTSKKRKLDATAQAEAEPTSPPSKLPKTSTALVHLTSQAEPIPSTPSARVPKTTSLPALLPLSYLDDSDSDSEAESHTLTSASLKPHHPKPVHKNLYGPSKKHPKDYSVGNTTYRVVKKENSNLPPKATDFTRRIKRQWMEGNEREGQKKNRNRVVVPKLGGGFVVKK